ncbi:AraC family transcriptional regulator [uncultured Ruegeria sp.]|uniref:helix-turn-helix transcriptional regulator n=1 Tax=uncultured Ruegeria sp. TaxID=259304 RepID=UPI00261EF26B|nr:AraC family transcriptional regulator [uncultured Ruegeria sp.]
MARRGVVNSFNLDSIAWRSSDQFEFLREEFAPMSGMLVERREPTRSPFEFRVQRYSVPSIALESATFGNPLQVRVTKKSMATAMSDRLSLHYRTAGTDSAAIFGNNTSVAGPQDLRIIDFQRPFYSDLSRFQSLNLVLNRNDVLSELPLIRDQGGEFIHNSSLSNTLRQLIICIFQELKSAPDAEAAQMLSHLRQLTIDTLRFHMIRDLNSTEIPSQSRLNVVLSYIEKHYNEQNLTPENLAAATGMSRATLYRLCRTIGSPRYLVQKTRLRKAAELIRSGEGTNIEALSHRVGFSGRQSFTRAFQREFELSPKEYRQEYSSCAKSTPDQKKTPCRWSKIRRTSLERVDNRGSCCWLGVNQAGVCNGEKFGTTPGVAGGIGIL